MAHVTFIHGIANKPAKDALLEQWRVALLDDDDDGMDMRHIVLQLEVIADGLAFEMFGTFPGL